MNQVKKIYCRIFQKAFHLVIPILLYRQPKKVEHLADIPSILKEKGVDRILIVTDQGIRSHGLLEPLEKALRENHIFYEIYDKTVANPTTDNVEEARELYLSKECQALIGFGGGCINDTIIHLATSELGFGGFGESGMGSYHGKSGFDTFSHYKSIVDKKTWLDLPMRYQPYRKINEKLVRFFLR